MKKLKGIILGVLLAASVLMPFNIYADDYSNTTIVGFDVQLYDTNIIYDNSTVNPKQIYIYKCHFVLDKSYVGYINLTIKYTPSGQSQVSNTNSYYVNGSDFYVSFYINDTSGSYSSDVRPALGNVTYTVNSHNLISNEINESKQWNFAFESFSFVAACFNNNLENVGFNKFNNYTYPIFEINQNDKLIQFWGSTDDQFKKYKMILFIDRNIYNISILNNYFSLSDGSFMDLKSLNRFRYNGRVSYVFEVSIGNFTSGGNKTITYIYNESSQLIPIYFDYYDYSNISTDFALTFGLNNSFLDDINTIAQGTSGSQSSASDLEDNNDQMAEDMNDLATIENGYNQNFNDQLENIDFTNPIQSNQGILPAANFVITVFNGLINNNPFSLLIIVCCILLIGKKVIGK